MDGRATLDDDAATLFRCGFDPEAYLTIHPDVAAAGLTGLQAAAHFLKHGLGEGRPAPIGCSVATFERKVAQSGLGREAEIVRAAAAGVAVTLGVYPVEPDLLRHLDGCDRVRPLVVIGDSHSHAYRAQTALVDMGWLPLVLVCSGGSARGLLNPLSQSGYGRKVELFLRDAGPRLVRAGGVLMFKFGQVDIEFVYSLRRLELAMAGWDDEHFLEWTAAGIRSYVSFLTAMKALLPAELPVCVAGAFPPALFDSQLRAGYMNGHIAYLNGADAAEALQAALAAYEFPDLARRTRIHRRFNAHLQAAVEDAGLTFVDDFSSALDGETVAPALVEGHGGTDHHIDASSPRLREVLAAVVAAFPGRPRRKAKA